MGRVLPSNAFTLFCLAALVAARILAEALLRYAGNWGDVRLENNRDIPEMVRGYEGLCVIVPSLLAVFYGFFRALARNPVFNSAYATALRRTPWRWPMPLPWGAVLPAWQDLIVLATLSLFACTGMSWPCLVPAAVAILVYLVTLAAASIHYGLREELFLVILALAAAIHWRTVPLLCGLAALIALAASCRSMAKTLEDFHHWKFRIWGRDLQDPRAFLEHGPLGAAYDALAPARLGDILTVRQSVLCGVMAASCLWAINLPNIAMDSASQTRLAMLSPALLLAALRAMYFGRRVGAPLSLRGRLRTGRWLIPNYDRVFVPSIVIILAGLLIPFPLAWLDLSFLDSLAIAFGIDVALLFGLPPSLETWRLTSEARLRIPSREQSRRANSPA
jgi:hypothetical protein